jgi:hypothetical protein
MLPRAAHVVEVQDEVVEDERLLQPIDLKEAHILAFESDQHRQAATHHMSKLPEEDE